MSTMTKLALAAGALALGGLAIQSAQAADMQVQQGYEAPQYAGYAPPPVAYYPPPPVAYYAPPPVAYYAPAYVVGPYYRPYGYWRGYGPRFAYGYGRHFDRGWRR